MKWRSVFTHSLTSVALMALILAIGPLIIQIPQTSLATGNVLDVNANVGSNNNDTLLTDASTELLQLELSDSELASTVSSIPVTPIPQLPADEEEISTLTPIFVWSAFQDGGDADTQAGYQLRIRCDDDGDVIVYDTGFVEDTSGNSHTYSPGAFVGIDPVTGDNRESQPLEWGKHYHWHVRYRDSGGDWSGWSANLGPAHFQDFIPVRIVFVDADATGTNDGSSWNNAFIDLQDALDSAVSGSEIWVAAGTYKPSAERAGSGDRYKSFQMIQDVAIYGGFGPSVGDDQFIERDWNENVTVLSGDIGVPGENSDNCYHVICNSDYDDPFGFSVDGSKCLVGPTTVLDGFTITGGNANGEGTHALGGGMFNGPCSSPIVSNCIFTGNSADFGGAMTNWGTHGGPYASPEVSNCIFINNTADDGGAMGNHETNPSLTNCIFTNNTAITRGGAIWNDSTIAHIGANLTECTFSGNEAVNGGALWSGGSAFSVTDCTFENNTSTESGGAIWHQSGDTFRGSSFTNCIITGNSAGDDGGGMYNESSSSLNNCTFTNNLANRGGGMFNALWWGTVTVPEVTDCTFEANTSSGHGGGMYNDSSSPTIVSCTFSENAAVGQTYDDLVFGGGIYNDNSSPVLTDCDFTDNSAYYGGGMGNDTSFPTMTSCIFTSNSAYRAGGVHNDNSSNPIMTNCIFSSNSAIRTGGAMINSTSSPSLTNCAFLNNYALDGYGGIFNYASASTYINCTFVGNYSIDIEGGAMGNNDSSPTITNSVFYDNSAPWGAGIDNSASSSPIITNCILWNNYDLTGTNDEIFGGTSLISYSDIEGCGGSGSSWDTSLGMDGGGNIDEVPLLTADFHLEPTSPCIDTGDNSALNLPTTDFEGDDRIVDGDGDGSAIVDMGADEYSGAPLDSDGDGVPDTVDNCPDIPNARQVDSDGDGLGDVCDDCLDVDQDSICDHVDNCPNTPNTDQTDTDGDGIGDACDDCLDSDGDGICDPNDVCPGGDDTVDADSDGTPDDCDSCPNDADDDADGDGVCGDVDVCPGGDDTVDADSDGIPDDCDICPGDPLNDEDEDGVCGSVDNCPLVSNPDQEDSDGDGTGDVCAATAPDFSITEDTALTDQVFIDQGASCSGSCPMTLDYSNVNISMPGDYAYGVICGENCGDDTDQGIVTVIPAVVTHTVTFTAGTGGSLSGETSQIIPDGEDCTTVIAHPDPGYQFANWIIMMTPGAGFFSNLYGEALTISYVTGDIQATANFKVSAATGGGPVAGGGGGGFFPPPVVPSVPTPTATPTPTPVVAPTPTPPPPPPPPAPPTPTPVTTPTPVLTPEEIEEPIEEPMYTLTIGTEPSEGGLTNPQPGDHIYAKGTQVSITATAEEDWEFMGWSGDISDTDTTVVVTMDQNLVITANFEEDEGSPTNWALISGLIIAVIAAILTIVIFSGISGKQESTGNT